MNAICRVAICGGHADWQVSVPPIHPSDLIASRTQLMLLSNLHENNMEEKCKSASVSGTLLLKKSN